MEKIRGLFAIYKKNRTLQYGVILFYLIMWLFSSGSLSTTILVGVGIGLGWTVGKGEEE